MTRNPGCADCGHTVDEHDGTGPCPLDGCASFRDPASLAEQREFYASIIGTAMEGSIKHWATTASYRWFDPEHGGSADPGPEGTANAVGVIVPASDAAALAVEWPTTVDGREQVEVTVEKVSAAVDYIVRRRVPVRDEVEAAVRRGYAEWDAAYIDASAADAVVQVAVFGEVAFA